MADLPLLSNLDDMPVYTIKTVVQETGIAPATLRAWERRYHCLSPGRSDGGYRLYSERDIAIVRWLQRQVDAGVAISRAVALLTLRHPDREASEAGVDGPVGAESSLDDAPNVTAHMRNLVEALLAFQEARAEAILSEAFALYPVDVVIEAIISPVLIELGERWHAGIVTVVQEHFATAFLCRRLTTLFQTYEQPRSGPLVITGAAPSERHDVGILLVALALRRHGWRVIYLGQNVPTDQLLQEIRNLKPEMVCLSATMPASAEALLSFCADVQRLPAPRPRLVLGGQAFVAHPDLRDRFHGCEILASPRALIEKPLRN